MKRRFSIGIVALTLLLAALALEGYGGTSLPVNAAESAYTLPEQARTNNARVSSGAATSFSSQTTAKVQLSIIDVASGAPYQVDDFAAGIDVFIDRTFVYSFIPDALSSNVTYIRTANNDKLGTANPFLTFSIDQDASIMVAHDDQLFIPAWLQPFTDTGTNLSISGQSHSIFTKDFPQGQVSLGGNEGVDSSSMYVVLAAVQGSITFPDPPPPSTDGKWPTDVALSVGESYVYTLIDGTTRTLKLVSYDVLPLSYEKPWSKNTAPRHLIKATVEVSGNEKIETHTLNVAYAGVPVSINGLRVYAYVWKEANDFGYEFDGISSFPMPPDKDVGFALNDAQGLMFPELDSYTYPLEVAFFEGQDIYQSYLEPSGNGPGAEEKWAHAGTDMKLPLPKSLVAMTDGYVWTKGPWDPTAPKEQQQGALYLSPTGPDESQDRIWFWSHVDIDTLTFQQGDFVTKGTLLANKCGACGGFHMGAKSSFDFGSWLFVSELWNYEHRTDFPAPRYWLILGPYSGDMTNNRIAADETGDFATPVLPEEGAFDRDGNRQWQFRDNYVGSVTHMGELLSESPFSGSLDQNPTNSVAYAATYVYSPDDHSSDNEVYLKFGATYGATVWLNGKKIHDNSDNLASNRYHTYDTVNEPPLIIDEFDIPLQLARGWNTLIIKTSQGSHSGWRFSSKIGDIDGNLMPEIKFSTRNIDLQVTSTADDRVDISWSNPDFHGTFVESYKLDVALDEGFTKLVVQDVDLGLATSHTIQGLGAGLDYFIRVKPFNSEMGGSVYWQHFDAVGASTTGTPTDSVALAITAPISGETILDDGVDVVYSTSGNFELADHVVLRLDDGPEVTGLPLSGSYRFNGVFRGPHTVSGRLVDSSGNIVDDQVISVSFILENPTPPVADGIVADPRVNGWLHVEGNRIVDESGNVVMLRGANVSNWQWIWDGTPDKSQVLNFERSAIPVLAGDAPDGWEANLVHFDIATLPAIQDDQDYLNALDELVALARDNGAYMLFSLRYEGMLEEPSRPTEIIAQGAGILAERYKDEPAVMFVAGSEPRNIGWGELKPLITDVIDAIRASNPKVIVAAPGTRWSRYVYHNLDDPIQRENIILQVSTFDKFDIVQNGGEGFEPYRLDEVTDVYPVVIGGFGLTEQSGSTFSFSMTEFADLVAELDYFESRGIHWTAWLFHDKFCPCMLTDSNTFDTTNYGEEIKIRLQAAAEQDGAPPDPDPTTPVLSTANALVNIGQTVDVDLVLDIAPGGINDFDLSLSMSSASAIIVGAVLAPEFSHAPSNTIANVDRLVGVDFADAFTDGATSIRLATLTIEGASKGNAKLVITVNSMNDDANVSMAPNISGGTIDVNGSPVVDAGPDVTIGEQVAF
ncbi:MAG: cellulase family glycosylhydrolase, partial [Chloroflexi bacterium]|nr:cellulase family glycosylhydrolase [Chloroflexota bacterium]